MVSVRLTSRARRATCHSPTTTRRIPTGNPLTYLASQQEPTTGISGRLPAGLGPAGRGGRAEQRIADEHI